jgi:hypothetical protein
MVRHVPVRKIGMNRRSLTGRVVVRSIAVGFESALEKDFLTICDFNLAVSRVREQPIRVPTPGSKFGYVPDFLVDHTSGDLWLYEIKYREDLERDWQELRPRFRAANAWARRNGARFSVLTDFEIRAPFLENIRFLRSYRNHEQRPEIEHHLALALAGLGNATPESLLRSAYPDQAERVHAISPMWRMLSYGQIRADLNHPLTMKSPISMPAEEGSIWQIPFSRRSIRALSSR